MHATEEVSSTLIVEDVFEPELQRGPANNSDIRECTYFPNCVYRVLKNNVYTVSGMIEEVKTNIFLFGKTLPYALFCR